MSQRMHVESASPFWRSPRSTLPSTSTTKRRNSLQHMLAPLVAAENHKPYRKSYSNRSLHDHLELMEKPKRSSSSRNLHRPADQPPKRRNSLSNSPHNHRAADVSPPKAARRGSCPNMGSSNSPPNDFHSASPVKQTLRGQQRKDQILAKAISERALALSGAGNGSPVKTTNNLRNHHRNNNNNNNEMTSGLSQTVHGCYFSPVKRSKSRRGSSTMNKALSVKSLGQVGSPTKMPNSNKTKTDTAPRSMRRTGSEKSLGLSSPLTNNGNKKGMRRAGSEKSLGLGRNDGDESSSGSFAGDDTDEKKQTTLKRPVRRAISDDSLHHDINSVESPVKSSMTAAMMAKTPKQSSLKDRLQRFPRRHSAHGSISSHDEEGNGDMVVPQFKTFRRVSLDFSPSIPIRQQSNDGELISSSSSGLPSGVMSKKTRGSRRRPVATNNSGSNSALPNTATTTGNSSSSPVHHGGMTPKAASRKPMAGSNPAYARATSWSKLQQLASQPQHYPRKKGNNKNHRREENDDSDSDQDGSIPSTVGHYYTRHNGNNSTHSTTVSTLTGSNSTGRSSLFVNTNNTPLEETPLGRLMEANRLRRPPPQRRPMPPRRHSIDSASSAATPVEDDLNKGLQLMTCPKDTLHRGERRRNSLECAPARPNPSITPVQQRKSSYESLPVAGTSISELLVMDKTESENTFDDYHFDEQELSESSSREDSSYCLTTGSGGSFLQSPPGASRSNDSLLSHHLDKNQKNSAAMAIARDMLREVEEDDDEWNANDVVVGQATNNNKQQPASSSGKRTPSTRWKSRPAPGSCNIPARGMSPVPPKKGSLQSL